jgi:hypothetical protein
MCGIAERFTARPALRVPRRGFPEQLPAQRTQSSVESMCLFSAKTLCPLRLCGECKIRNALE